MSKTQGLERKTMTSPDYESGEKKHSSGVQKTGLLTGLQPAFQHIRTGESHLAQVEEGIPALVYGFAGLPEEWVVERDDDGNAIALDPEVVAGYWRDARFISLSQLRCMPLDA